MAYLLGFRGIDELYLEIELCSSRQRGLVSFRDNAPACITAWDYTAFGDLKERGNDIEKYVSKASRSSPRRFNFFQQHERRDWDTSLRVTHFFLYELYELTYKTDRSL